MSLVAGASCLLDLLSQLPLFLQNFELQSFNTVFQSLPSLLYCFSSQLRLAAQLLTSTTFRDPAIWRVSAFGSLRETTLLELSARLKGFNAAFYAVDMRVGAAEKDGNSGAYLIAQGSFGGGEGGLRDEFVVLWKVRQERDLLEQRQRLTRTVLSTPMSRGKSATPVPKVSTEDSKCDKEPRRVLTQSPYA